MRKVCPRCKQEKDLTDFGRDKNEPGGLKRWCKKCRCAHEGERYRPIKERNARARTEMQYRVTRVCSKCGQEKPLSDFYRYYKDSSRVRANCIECQRSYKRTRAGVSSRKKYERSDKGKMAKLRSKEKNYSKFVARYKLNNAIKLGWMERDDKCSVCGSTNDIQAHHPDYNDPLRAIFLCKNCHTKLHHERTMNAPIH